MCLNEILFSALIKILSQIIIDERNMRNRIEDNSMESSMHFLDDNKDRMKGID